MKKKRRPSRGTGFWGPGLFVTLLVLPVGYRIAQRSRQPEAALAEAFRDGEAALDAALLRDAVRRLRGELEAAAGWSFRARDLEDRRRRFRAVVADVLLLGDPSPTRAALWLGFDSPPGVPERSAVTFGGALLGSIEHAPPGLRVARARTVLDPAFRAKFRCGETLGVLHGTGRRGAGGRPLLEARHLDPLGSLPAGEPVFTAGGDGVYPPGLVVGEVVGEDADEAGSIPYVRAALDPDRAREAVVIVDLARIDLERARASLR